MPDPLSHHTDMITIRPNSKPLFWWLVPWAYACELHRAANAVKAYADHQDEIVDNQRQTIRHLMAENYMLQQRVRDQDDAIIRGTAITPDAHPHE